MTNFTAMITESGIPLKIVFICHGNICRSPMAECVMKHLVKTNHLDDDFLITSAAVSNEETGNPIYPPAARTLRQHGIDFSTHNSAHKITTEEFEAADLIIAMDRSNLRLLNQIIPQQCINQCDSRILDLGINKKVSLLMDFAGEVNKEVADPWYTGDFEQTFSDVMKGCRGLLNLLYPKL